MKFKYQVLHETTIQSQVLMERIISILAEQDYIIEDKTGNTVSFKDDNWKIRSKNKIFSKVDKGKFEISESKGGVLIIFTYYISFLPELIITTILIIISIVQNYPIIILAILLLIQLVARVLISKGKSKEMIKLIVD